MEIYSGNLQFDICAILYYNLLFGAMLPERHNREDEMAFEMREIPEGKVRGWRTFVDGEERPVSTIQLVSKFGTLTYGLRPEGYDGWVFREEGGGGAVTLPFTRTPKGELLVGLLLEKRANMGDKPVWCAIGGFVDPGETHKEAQAREAAEESGLDAVKAMILAGVPANSNRGFFVADASVDEGVHAYGMEIPFQWLDWLDEKEEDDGGSFRLKDAALLAGHKKADEVRFFTWRVAIVRTPDALARSAIAQLLATEL